MASRSKQPKQSLADHLHTACKPWEPALPANQIAAVCYKDAEKLRIALLPSLARLDSPLLTSAERVRIGLEDYRRAFNLSEGQGITPRHWQRLLDRTIERDRSENRFDRLELYLADRLQRAPAAASAKPKTEDDFSPLADCINRFHDPTQPTGEEIDSLWIESIELFLDLSSSAEKPKRLKRRLLDFLLPRAPFMAANFNALRFNFDRKLKRFQENESGEVALLDGRELKRGELRAPALPQEDKDRIVWHAAKNCGGRVAQAVRELAIAGGRSGLSGPTVETITSPSKSKSYVNRRIVSEVRADVELIAPHLLGKKAQEARALGVARGSALSPGKIQMRVEQFLQHSKLMLVIDEGQYLFPPGNRVYTPPELINWLMTACYNENVPFLISATSEFRSRRAIIEKNTTWQSEQLRGRIRRFFSLPAVPTKEDLFAVAEKLLPGMKRNAVDLVAGYSMVSQGFFQTITDTIEDAQLIARRDAREEIRFADLQAAIQDWRNPSDAALQRVFTTAAKPRRGRQQMAEPAEAMPEAPADRAGDRKAPALIPERINGREIIHANQ